MSAIEKFPVHVVALGNPSPDVPVAGFFGGFHGLERIGTAVVLAYLRSLVGRLHWDSVLHRQLESVRLVFMPWSTRAACGAAHGPIRTASI